MFECKHWTKSDLLNSIMIPAISVNKHKHILYSEFIDNLPRIIGGNSEQSDPRSPKNKWDKLEAYKPCEPAIAIIECGKNMLIDGYGRSIFFMKNGTEKDIFRVWMPLSPR